MPTDNNAAVLAKLDLILELYHRMEAEIWEIKADIKDLGTRVSRVEGRLEEQSNILQVALAGRQSRKPAA